MPFQPVILEVEFDPRQVDSEARDLTKKIEAKLIEAMGEILTRIELVQIKKYTTGANPPRPLGSRYVRTFNLRRASKTRITDDKLPNIGGEWYADEGIAPYAEKVLGSRAQQAPVHRGRWMTRPEVEKKAKEIAAEVTTKKIDEVK